MLPQELLLLSQDDVIVLRAGIPPLRGKKLRYYKDKWMVAASSVAPPPVAPRPIDPMVAKRSLAIIAATEAPEMYDADALDGIEFAGLAGFSIGERPGDGDRHKETGNIESKIGRAWGREKGMKDVDE